MLTLRVHLVRHGSTIWMEEGRFQGWSDAGLSDRGHRQGEALAAFLSGEPLVAVYASPLRRTLDTARMIAKLHGLVVQVDAGLREIHQGDLEGKTREYMVANHPDFYQQWRTDAPAVRLPGGETLAEVQERAWTAIQRIRQAHRNGVVAVVAHNFVICTILCQVAGVDLAAFRQFRQDEAARNIIEFGGCAGRITLLNDTSHLALVDGESEEGYGEP